MKDGEEKKNYMNLLLFEMSSQKLFLGLGSHGDSERSWFLGAVIDPNTTHKQQPQKP